VHLVGFIVRIYHVHGQLNIKQMLRFTRIFMHSNCSNVVADSSERKQKKDNVLQSCYQVGLQG